MTVSNEQLLNLSSSRTGGRCPKTPRPEGAAHEDTGAVSLAGMLHRNHLDADEEWVEEEQKGDSQTQAAAHLKPISTEHWPSLEINDGIIERGG